MIAVRVVFAAVFDAEVAARLAGRRTPCPSPSGRAIPPPRCLFPVRYLV
jgi:hypothetical protein